MVLRLARGLDLPLRDRNDLLRVAGFDPVYPERDLDDSSLAPFNLMIARLLDSHEPYPALVVNRWWDVVNANQAARLFVPELPVNLVELFLLPGPIRDMIENFEEAAPAVVHRLEREAAAAADDERLAALVEQARRLVGPRWEGAPVAVPAVPVRIRLGDVTLSTVSAVARFETSTEVTLSELRVELMYPADQATAEVFRALAGR
jgi:hypothetical protein